MIFFRRNLLFSYLTIAPTNILTKFSSVVVLLWKANSVLPLACLCSGPTTTTTLKKSSLYQTSLSLCSLVFPLPKRKPKITFQLFFTFGCNYSNFLPNNAFCRVGQLSFVCLCLCSSRLSSLFLLFGQLSFPPAARPSRVLDFKTEN